MRILIFLDVLRRVFLGAGGQYMEKKSSLQAVNIKRVASSQCPVVVATLTLNMMAL
jgi:hypothetical protein